MARKPRLQYPGAVYHVMSRGNHRQRIVQKEGWKEADLEKRPKGRSRESENGVAVARTNGHDHGMDCESAAGGNTDVSEPSVVLASQAKTFAATEEDELTILLTAPFPIIPGEYELLGPRHTRSSRTGNRRRVEVESSRAGEQ
jgi:hypothetical protein